MKKLFTGVSTLALFLCMVSVASAGLPTTRPIGHLPAVRTATILAAQHHGTFADCSGGGGIWAVTRQEMDSIPQLRGDQAVSLRFPDSKLCGIWIVPTGYGNAPAWATGTIICTLLAHEYGHLLGKYVYPTPHPTDPSTVMYKPVSLRRPTRGCYNWLSAPHAAEYQRITGGPPQFVTP